MAPFRVILANDAIACFCYAYLSGDDVFPVGYIALVIIIASRCNDGAVSFQSHYVHAAR
jgi:hypothetical protein